MTEVDHTPMDESFAASEAADEQSHGATASATVGTRRQANGTIGSVYSGNKIRHLKKEDGIPLWRKDIQYQFLKLVFEDKTAVFTRYPDGQKNMDFADIYIDAMARSSKTSKILKDKLQNDKPAAISMAMVCLLVNFGRMNTTLNFFPEMRAQLRTYHSIPSLQAHQDSNAYKQLQDAPRLKSILKGASEDVDQPNTLDKIKRQAIPRTNPVNLIFVLAQYAPKVSEMHFFPPRDFFDLVMRSTLSSKTRARAFLWLMWWYLESDFTRESALKNPFGPGLEGEGTDGLPLKVPAFESLTEEQANEENIDTQEELDYGESKRLERKRILEEDEPLPRVPKRSKKDYGLDDDSFAGDYSGLGGRGSAMSTPLHPSAKRSLDDDDDDLTPGSSRPRNKQVKRESSLNRAVGQQRLILKTKMDHTPDASPAPPGSNHPVLNRFIPEPSLSQAPGRRPRPLTQHQIAVEQNRRQRVEYLLAKRKNNAYRVLRKKREEEIPLVRSGRLLQNLPDGYDTEDEDKSFGKAGLLPNPEEEDDYGECASFFLSVVRKAARRLDRWDYEDANGPKKDRQKEREERQRAKAALEADVRAANSRARPRVVRSAAAKRKSTGPTSTPGAAKKTASRPKGGRSRPPGIEGTGASSVGTPTWDPENAAGDEEIEGELDDIDRELLGEASGEEDIAPRVGDVEGDSSDESGDEDGDVDGDENSSTYDGPNGYARHESSSPVPEGAVGRREGADDAMEE
ncbi:Ino eighty subunit 1 [Penicillium macrosclerotiorum]|uniref:Ino eighty subunit 1 n=1 Tax=Penicillium macrosclerotiorum TaxID=303699 RepID=UPI0025478019|nr:Ino eighty subunit 1 [Penicillium macrosclerotiorum]KAJ5673815.1 Ino eighty subunit 1 [Penicillium macrosclerotiorum]